MNKKPTFILGLTGSIAMGKSTVSDMFRELGTPVWCADKEVANLYKKNGAGTKAIFKKYPGVVTNTGVDKNKLRDLIHNNNRILKDIEGMVHPLLGRSKEHFMKTNKDLPLIIFDIPLLFEKKQEKNFDAVLVVTASELTQRKRVLRRNNITEKDFLLIKRNQMNEEEKISMADFVINTDKKLIETKQEVFHFHNKLIGIYR